jgi:hypothetical protein
VAHFDTVGQDKKWAREKKRSPVMAGLTYKWIKNGSSGSSGSPLPGLPGGLH